MKINFSLLILLILFIISCKSNNSYDPVRSYSDIQKDLTAKFILAEDSSVIELPEGHFLFDKSLSLEGKSHLTIKGKGIDKTVLSFKGQTDGAEGLRITNCNSITLEDFTVEDAAGDNIKVMDTKDITFRRMKVAWTGKINEDNGAYGFYPVMCNGVIIEECESMGSSDAGVYVGQSENVIIRNNIVYQNVAGIESENSDNVQIYGNEVYDNTGGILVFNLPGLSRYGRNIKVYENNVYNNNRKNFSVPGAIVGYVPAGAGMIILATSNVEVYQNSIKGHKTGGIAIVSYELIKAMDEMNDEKPDEAELPDGIAAFNADYKSDPNYDPYPGKIYIHNNVYDNNKWIPDLNSDMGKLLLVKNGLKTPDVIIDGILPDNYLGENGRVNDAYKICIEEEGVKFLYLDAENDFKGMHENVNNYKCEQIIL
ncbi:right-handed parallel beta-helix repeat-containing protein [Mangrovivirga sp. M17]|uniref:Right-handed parallel beta-helix repeat-containing protein n=1 Tax=Mangrovivirga halotolerans TaxID=2993936 RepID=A0ABT3RX04_9BACT|nr:parallel beta-helix domain-containing protein [Mangrovivirga halotolerans]MCX2745888.1 right-handed parallel beta-helix repeat-containing protein [Mangrovivirga halotolerans]